MIEDREYSDQQLEEVLNKSEKWFNIFAESSFFDELNNYEQDEAGFIIKCFSEFMYNYFLMLPEEWDISTTEECCLELFPRKISADTAFYELISPVLSSFCRFLSKEKLLKNGNALSDCIFKLNDQIVENASNSSNWGPAKSFVMMAKECGVNIENRNDLDNFVNVYNDYQLEKEEDEMLDYMFEEREPFSRETPKVGRNEPCPCGSGKKYKKCCGR